MTEYHTIQREIGIDAGHRVPDHGSKCKNLHGHRYTIRAYCEGPLFKLGEQTGMVLDFGFLKEEMMTEIDKPCDHGLILWIDDPLLELFAHEKLIACARRYIEADGYSSVGHGDGYSKIYVVPFVPTAENLARHWYARLAPRVRERSAERATLLKVRVEETPNCWAEYERPLF